MWESFAQIETGRKRNLVLCNQGVEKTPRAVEGSISARRETNQPKAPFFRSALPASLGVRYESRAAIRGVAEPGNGCLHWALELEVPSRFFLHPEVFFEFCG